MSALLQLIRPRKHNCSSLRKRPQDTQKRPPAFLDCHIVTSPIVVENDSDNGDGSIISGSLKLEVTEDMIELHSLCAVLRVHTVNKKPFKKGCKDCKHRFTELKRCEVVTTVTTLNKGNYTYALSYRIPSYAPPSIDTSAVSVTYEFEAVASIRRARQLPTSLQTITLKRVLPIARSIPVPSTRTCSYRIYQTAGMEVGCSFDTAMDPRSKNRATLTMSGLRSSPGNGDEVHFWRICSGSWILEETIKTTTPACLAHRRQDKEDTPQEQKRRLILGDSTFYDGWTIDDDAGTLSMDFYFSIRKSMNHYAQDTGDVDDVSVSHALVLELQMMKEICPRERPDLVTRTGVGRILRSEHRVVLSDYTTPSCQMKEERLPSYESICAGPPVYEEP